MAKPLEIRHASMTHKHAIIKIKQLSNFCKLFRRQALKIIHI